MDRTLYVASIERRARTRLYSHAAPHVERLVESFAFLTGNVRQKLEDDFPELTHSLLDLVWLKLQILLGLK